MTVSLTLPDTTLNMSSEPNYEYVKGQGWVIVQRERFVTTDAEGKTVYLEKRPPVKGERYFYASRVMSVNIEHVQAHCFEEFGPCPTDTVNADCITLTLT